MRKTVIVMGIVFLLFAFPALWLNTQKGVHVWDEFLVCKNDKTYGDVQLVRENGVTRFSGWAAGNDFTAELRWDGEHAVATFPDGQTVSGRWDGAEYLRAEDGLPLVFTHRQITVTVNGQPPPMAPVAKANILCQMDQNIIEQRGSIWMVILGLAAYVIGALCFLFPEAAHFFGNRWQYDHAELSDAGIFAQKSSGVVIMAIGVIAMYAIFFA